MSSIPHRGVGHRRLRGLAVAACVLVWLAAAPGPIAVFMSSLTFGWNARTTEARVGMMLLGGGFLTLFLGCAAAGVVVIMWLWRARAAACVRTAQSSAHARLCRCAGLPATTALRRTGRSTTGCGVEAGGFTAGEPDAATGAGAPVAG